MSRARRIARLVGVTEVPADVLEEGASACAPSRGWRAGRIRRERFQRGGGVRGRAGRGQRARVALGAGKVGVRGWWWVRDRRRAFIARPGGARRRRAATDAARWFAG